MGRLYLWQQLARASVEVAAPSTPRHPPPLFARLSRALSTTLSPRDDGSSNSSGSGSGGGSSSSSSNSSNIGSSDSSDSSGSGSRNNNINSSSSRLDRPTMESNRQGMMQALWGDEIDPRLGGDTAPPQADRMRELSGLPFPKSILTRALDPVRGPALLSTKNELDLADSMIESAATRSTRPPLSSSLSFGASSSYWASSIKVTTEPHHLHIYSHKHNTHVTLTRPDRNPVLSMSCGNIGFKHSKRKYYDAAYQLMQYVMQQIEKRKLADGIEALEVIFQGFGQGRDATAKVLLSPEGAALKKKVIRVSDATKIKFGGTRSKNPRRI